MTAPANLRPVAAGADAATAALEALADQRAYIDRIDQTIVALLAERIRIGLTLGAIKQTLALPLRSELREQDVLARVRARAFHPLSAAAVERIFTAIIEETRAVQGDGH